MRRVTLATVTVAMGIMFLKGACVMAAESNPVAGSATSPTGTNAEMKATAADNSEVAVTETKFGKIVIEFYDDTDLGRLYERLIGGAA